MRELHQPTSMIYHKELALSDTNDARIIAYDFIPMQTTVLDVGAACGDFGLLVSNTKDCSVHGIEYDQSCIAVARDLQVYHKLHQIDLNLITLNDLPYQTEEFEIIVLLDVLEHLLDPKRVLHTFIPLLTKNGSFVISLPNVAFCDVKVGILHNEFQYTTMGILDETHLKFFTYKSISELLASSGLEIESCRYSIKYFSIEIPKLPIYLKRYIQKDPHSFIYQYIFKAIPSKKSHETLREINESKMDVDWPTISMEFKKQKKRYLIKKYFPIGSLQYNILKSLRNYLNL